MALRVLLADESSTIKKVFQLALQDFAVEVKPVNIGLDVLPVAKSFQPDIVFADVLLQKRNGYEVSSDLKADATLSKVPVVLMWSGFMELDEDKYEASEANGRLEKPFDVAALRKLVSDLVPKTQSQKLSQFLTFPTMPEIQEPAKAHHLVPPDEEEFQQVPIPKMKSNTGRFRIKVEATEADIPVALNMSDDPIDVESILRGADEPDQFTMRENKAVAETPPPVPELPVNEPPPLAAPLPQLTEEQIEAIVRNQAKEMVEAIVWKVLPELAQQIIEREIQKLLNEKDAGTYR